MSKQNLPQTNEDLNNAARFLQLILKPDKTLGEQGELNDLIVELSDYMIGAEDWNNMATKDGNVATASKLKDAVDIALDGDASGTTSFDGSQNVTITVSLSDFLKLAGGTMTGILTAQANNQHGTRQVRNIVCKTTPFNAAECQHGDLWVQLEE